MKRLLVLLFALCAATAAPAADDRSTTYTFKGSVAAAENYFIPFYTPFEVPRGTTRIEVRQSFSAPDGRKCNLDLGIFSTVGTAFGGEGFRGWSGGARRSFVLSEEEATPGYLAGPIEPGEWYIVQMATSWGVPRIDWELEVVCHRGKRAKAPFRPSYAAMRLKEEPGWYRFDTHVHTHHSDGAESPETVVRMARENGLDGIFSTDHNTTSSLRVWGMVQRPDLLVVPGVEVTFQEGHWNLVGMNPDEWIDFRYHYTERERHAAMVRRAHDMGAVTVANHPYDIVFRYDKAPLDGIEVWNGPWSAGDEKALGEWDALLRAGIVKFASAGTDFHDTRLTVGSPQTVIYARALATPEVIEGLALGRSYLARDSRVDLTMEARCADRPAERVMLGGTLVRSGRAEVLFRTSVRGATLALFDQNGPVYMAPCPADTELVIALPGDSRWVRAELRDDKRRMVALTNPIFVAHAACGRSLCGE